MPQIRSTPAERADPKLVLKATPPRLMKHLLARPRLSSESAEFNDRSIMAVSAPGGFGKTSLLGQWRREWLQRGAVVAWLTLDEYDDDDRFVLGLAVAMRVTTGNPVFDKFSGPTLSASEYSQQALTEWLSEVANLAVDVVLILDDAGMLPALTVQRSLLYLLYNAPANLKVIVASRRPISLPLAELMANGQFAPVGADLLRFTFDETTAVLKSRFGQRIAADTCGHLHEITEGWPLGLQLVITAIERSADVNRAAAELQDCPADMERYFVECLTARLPADLNEFLARISIVDAITPDFCRALTGRADAAEVLAALCNATPIIVADDNSEWMRIHRLARTYLRSRFEALPDAERREAYNRAAHWLAEHQFWEEAARHARCAGLDEWAYGLAERGMYELITSGQYSSVLNWIGHMPEHEARQRPRVCLAAGWALALSERHDEAAQMVAPILQGDDQRIVDRCEAALITVAVSYFADKLDHCEEILAPWAAIDLGEAPNVQSTMANHLGAHALLRGDPEQARRLLKPRNSATELGITCWTDFYVGNSYLWEGKLQQAEEHLRAALQRTERDLGRRSSPACILAAALAATLWERDKTDEADLLLTHRLDVLERAGGPDALMLGYVTAARSATLQGQEARAFDLFEELCAIGKARGIARFVIAGLGEQIRLHALAGHTQTCAALEKRLDAAIPPEVQRGVGLLVPLMQLQIALARAFARMAERDWNGMRVSLDDAMEKAERLHLRREGVQIMLMRVLAMKRIGEDGTALLDEAISLAETYGLSRILAEMHRDLIDLAQRRQKPREGGAMPRSEPASGKRQCVRIMPSPLLTGKERNILHLLERGLTNKEIGLGLGVTDETVKWHLKNLFAKLSVGTRKHAVHRARMLGILETVH